MKQGERNVQKRRRSEREREREGSPGNTEKDTVVVDANSLLTATLAAKLSQISIDHKSLQAKRTQSLPC